MADRIHYSHAARRSEPAADRDGRRPPRRELRRLARRRPELGLDALRRGDRRRPAAPRSIFPAGRVPTPSSPSSPSSSVDGLLLTGGPRPRRRLLRRGRRPRERDRRPAARPGRARARARRRSSASCRMLGVCRGMQLLNVALGGGIDQHLADPERIHRGEPGDVRRPRGRGRCAGTRLAAILGERRGDGALPPPPGRRSARGAAGRRRPSRPTGSSRPPRSPTAPSASRCSGIPRRTWRRAACSLYDGAGRRRRGAAAAHGGRSVSVTDCSAMAEPLELAPSKIVATHLSYRSRCDEYRMAAPPRYPSYFLKPLELARPATAPTVARPRGCRFLNYEGEIAVVIGKRAHGVSRAEALDHVAGYTVANDFGVHDFRHIDRGSMLRVKGQDGFCPLGPGAGRRRRARSRGPHPAHLRQRRAGAGGPHRRPT